MFKRLRKIFCGFILDCLEENLDEFQVGGHCGLCGNWMPYDIFMKYWAWGVCDKCLQIGKEDKEKLLKMKSV